MIEQFPVSKTTKVMNATDVGVEQRQTLPKGSAAFVAAFDKTKVVHDAEQNSAGFQELIQPMLTETAGFSEIVVPSEAQAEMGLAVSIETSRFSEMEDETVASVLRQIHSVTSADDSLESAKASILVAENALKTAEKQPGLVLSEAEKPAENVFDDPLIELVSDENMQVDAALHSMGQQVSLEASDSSKNNQKTPDSDRVDEVLVEDIQAMLRPEDESAEETVSIAGETMLGSESEKNVSTVSNVTGQNMNVESEEKLATQQAAQVQETLNKDVEKQPKSENVVSDSFGRQLSSGREGESQQSARTGRADSGSSQMSTGQQASSGQSSGQQSGQQGQSNPSSQQAAQQQVMDQLNKQQVVKAQQAELKSFTDAIAAEEKRVERSERVLGSLGLDSRAQLPAQMQSIGYGVRTPQFGQAFGNRVVYMANNKVQEAKITLNPEKLGPIQIKLNVDKEQQVHVSVVAQHGTTREALESAMPRLKEMMESAGMEFGSFDVRDERAFADNQQGDEAGSNASGKTSENGSADDADEAAIVQVTSNNLVDYYA